jgi:hypothetical protein
MKNNFFILVIVLSLALPLPRAQAALSAGAGSVAGTIVGGLISIYGSGVFGGSLPLALSGGEKKYSIVGGTLMVLGIIILEEKNQVEIQFSPVTDAEAARLDFTNEEKLSYRHDIDSNRINGVVSEVASAVAMAPAAERAEVSRSMWEKAEKDGTLSHDTMTALAKIAKANQ